MQKCVKLVVFQYDKKERKFAEKIYETLNNPKQQLGSEQEIKPYKLSLGYGSTDVGDVSIAVPTVGIATATWVPGTSAHSWQAVAASANTIGFKGAQNAAKALALGVIELMQNDQLMAEAEAEFSQRRGDGFVYEPLLGDRTPPLDYRK